MNKTIIITAAIFGMLAVITGAFGAHQLKALLEPEQLQVWHTGVEYQFYHALALLFLGLFSRNIRIGKGFIVAAYYLFTLGIIFFSGSLYLLACRDQLGFDWIWIMGPITPVGGLLFIGGWIMLILAAIKAK